MNCKAIEESILAGFTDWSLVRSVASGECLVRLPFWDGNGDPIDLTVTVEDGLAVISDNGSIAGLLFSLGQDHQGAPALKLLDDLARAHNLKINYDEGLVQLSISEKQIYDGIAEMAKVVLSMKTVVPHIRVFPRRPGSFGPRLRSKVAKKYRELEILHLVERSYPLVGATVSEWPIDFHWSVGHNGTSYDVNVITADLAVAEPLVKAQKIAALSVDTRAQHQSGQGQLRVAIESRDDNDQSMEAANFLRIHSDELDYRLFDLRQSIDEHEFYSSSFRELTIKFSGNWAEQFMTTANRG